MDDFLEGCLIGLLVRMLFRLIPIVLVIALAIWLVRTAYNAATAPLENIWNQITQILQQIKDLFGVELPDLNPPPGDRDEAPPLECEPATEPLRLTIEERAVVRTDPTIPLRCRKSPGTEGKDNSDIIARLENGTRVPVKDGPCVKDGFDWWQVETPSKEYCWVAGNWLCDNKYEGIQYCREGKTHYLLVDLQNPYVRVETVTADDSSSVNPPYNCSDPRGSCDARETVESIGERYRQKGAAAVINADYFGPGHGAEGLTVRRGVRLDGEANGDCDHNPQGKLAGDECGDNGIYKSALAVLNSKVAVIGKNLWQSYEGSIANAVGGGPRILHSGQVIPIHQGCDDEGFKKEGMLDPKICTSPPTSQTFAGVNPGGNTLLLGVSAAMSVEEAAKFVNDHGMGEGMKLDGGGSSTMWYDGGLVYKGHREVANALVVFSVPSH